MILSESHIEPSFIGANTIISNIFADFKKKARNYCCFFSKPIDSGISAVYNDSNNSDISAVKEETA